MKIIVQTSYQQEPVEIDDIDGATIADNGTLLTYVEEDEEQIVEPMPGLHPRGYGINPSIRKEMVTVQKAFIVFAPGAWLRYDVDFGDETAAV